MSSSKRLSELMPNEVGTVLFINSKPEIRRRLSDIGLIPDTKVTCAFKSPWGDPSAYFIRGALIALRAEDAHTITVMAKSGGGNNVPKKQAEKG